MKLLVVDGNSILNRAFYGIRILTTAQGLYTNGVYGFVNILLKMLDELQPDGVAVAFDLPQPTRRHRQYDGYKANRKGMPPELRDQLPLIKELLTLMGHTVVECPGFEADDILGTLARACKGRGDVCFLATGDRDSLQLIDDAVTVRLAATKGGKPAVTLYDRGKIREDYGIEPVQLIEVKGLMGDSSDNIPGVAGIGEKTALDLIRQHGSIEKVYENLNEMRPALRDKLEKGRDMAFLSRDLGRIDCDAPVDVNPEDYTVRPADAARLKDMLVKLEFFSLAQKLVPGETGTPAPAAEQAVSVTFRRTESLPELESLLRECEPLDVMARYDGEGRVEALAFAREGEIVVCGQATPEVLRLFFCSGRAWRMHDTKPLYKALMKAGVNGYNIAVFDSMLAAYLINPSASNYSPDRLFEEYLPGTSAPECSEENRLFLPLARLPRLLGRLEEKIREDGQDDLLRQVELPLAEVLASMETVGFYVDRAGIQEFSASLDGELSQLTALIYQLAGETFNINSPKQLGVILFEKLGLKAGKKKATGYSTNVEVLESLADEHPIIEAILRYRKLAKLKSTYCDGLLKVIDPADGRIRSSFNQVETRTGRISSTEPNLQNIPVRDPEGKQMRRFFAAGPGCVLIDADYSQIELRVLAHIAGDEAMIDAFNHNADIHTITASQVFRLPPEMVTSQMRSRAKAVNFGIVYGIGAFSLAGDINVSVREAREYIEQYFRTYPKVKQYMDAAVEQAKETGKVSTFLGRVRHLPELSSSNANIRAFGQRVAMNMPIQGAAADIIKIAMVRVRRRLREQGLQSRLILQVHDELIVEAPENELETAKSLLKEEMEHAVNLAVTLRADVSTGKTWYEAKE